MYAPLSHPRRRMHSRFVLAFALLTALALWVSEAKPAHAGYYPPAHSDAAYFHDSLSPYGTWTHHASYGAVWYPHGMAHGWRPYTHGRWVWDDGYGWTWASGFAWGWAPFHYGNWVWDAAFGWIWVPGRVWAPAWVTWRYSSTYIGWAPIGYGASYWSYSPGWNHGGWNYVHRHHFGAPVIHQHIVVVNQYKTIYRNTKHWAPPRNKYNRVVHRGFDRGFVEHGSRYKIDRVHARPEHWQRNHVRGGVPGRNDWHDNRHDDRRDGVRHIAPDRRIDGRHGDPTARHRDAHRPQGERQLQDRQRQQSHAQQVLQRQRQSHERQGLRQVPPRHERQHEQRQQQMQERQAHRMQQQPQWQMQQHRQQPPQMQHQAHRTSPPQRQMQERQRPPQQMQQHRQPPQVQQQRRPSQAQPHRQAQQPQRQREVQPRAPAVQRQAPPRHEQRAERRDDGGRDIRWLGGDGREGNRSWR